MFLLAAIWASALTISQHFSLPAEDTYRMKDHLGRFLLSFCILTPFVLLAPRPIILAGLMISLLFQWGTLYYFSYFGAPPEIMVLLNNAAEGAEVGDAVWATLPWQYLLFLIPVFVLQTGLLYRYAPPKSFYSQRLKKAVCFIVAFGTLYCTLDVLARSSPGRISTGSRCAKFGFLPVFAQDIAFRYTSLDKLKQQAMENESKWSFGLQSEYNEFSIGDVVIIQVETLDNAVLDFFVDDKPVVPFLNSLQQNSLTYRLLVQPYSSAGNDFAMLNGIPALTGFFNYKIPDLPYNNSLARFFNEHGYETFVFHGVHGSFYNRRAAYTAMDFDHLVFREDIIEAVHSGKYPLCGEFSEEELEKCLNANWLRDDVVLETTLQAIRQPSERNRFFFVITATSHSPFRTEHIDSKDKLIPDETSQSERYLNSIHIVDRWLHSFYKRLPSGTLLVIYGDHSAKILSGTFASDMEGHREFVPCFIHVVGEDLSAFQKVPRWSEETDISVRDVHLFLRILTERQAALQGR